MSDKPKILLLVDVPGWALDRVARNVASRLSDLYTFEICYNENAAERLPKVDFDLLYFSYWKQYEKLGPEVRLPRNTCAGIHSHFKWDGGKGLAPSKETLARLSQYRA